MTDMTLERLKPAAADRIRPFLQAIIEQYSRKIHSIHVTGSCITEDFDPKISDVNSIFILKEMDLAFLEVIAPLGKKYGKHRVAAPLIMTPGYIHESLDVFPIEFLNFKLVHETVYGEDILETLQIKRMDLRHQCERELKIKLIWLRQGYISSAGDRKALTEGFVNSIAGYIPLFRGIIVLLGSAPPVLRSEVINALGTASGVDTSVFGTVLRQKHASARLSIEQLNTIFEDYYGTTEQLGKIVDEIRD